VVEIVSPKQSVNPLIQRCLRFLERGAQAALLVNPSDESVRLFRPGQAMAVLRGADAIDLEAILPGFELTVQELFDSLLV
jgi:Uma2 family endonuclease